MKTILLIHSFLFIQFVGYASCVEELSILKTDTVIPERVEQSVTGQPIHPIYPGGEAQMLKDLQNNLVYPRVEKSKGIQGKLMIQFYVETDGSINEIKVVRSIKDGENLDKAAIQAVKRLKRFTPAKNYKGEPIRLPLVLPVHFKLAEETDVEPKK